MKEIFKVIKEAFSYCNDFSMVIPVLSFLFCMGLLLLLVYLADATLYDLAKTCNCI